MQASINITAAKNVPKAIHHFIQHLSAKYRTQNIKAINFHIIRAPYFKHNTSRAYGFCTPMVINSNTYCNIQVAIGSVKQPLPLPFILDTIAHEYKHATQKDTNPLALPSPSREEEATRFAAIEVEQYLSKYQIAA